MNRIIFVDFHTIVYKLEFSKNNIFTRDYSANNILFSIFKKLKVMKNDLVLIVVNSVSSWRKDIDNTYNFKCKELEPFYKALLSNLNISTPFHILNVENLEARDLISYGCRYYKDKECIVVADSKDYEQLVAFKNVKIFSNRSKKFKVIFENPYKMLAKKTNGEKNKFDYDRKVIITNLLSLPKNIEEQVEYALMNLDLDKEYDINRMKFESMKERFVNFYNVDDSNKKLKEGQLILN